MSVAVNDIIDRAETILQDTTNTTWPALELIDWLNAGQIEIVLLKPEASVTNEAMVLVVSETKQSLPTTGIQLLDVVRNMGTDGLVPGDAIRLIKRKILDEQLPAWHSEAGNAVVKHFMFDDRDPKHFYVYPPQPAATPGYVEVIYSSAPTTIAAGGDISIDDVYANALLDYILYRAYSKDADYAANNQRALGHYQAFQQSMRAKDAAELLNDPENEARAMPQQQR